LIEGSCHAIIEKAFPFDDAGERAGRKTKSTKGGVSCASGRIPTKLITSPTITKPRVEGTARRRVRKITVKAMSKKRTRSRTRKVISSMKKPRSLIVVSTCVPTQCT
jgi:hypothetical protein